MTDSSTSIDRHNPAAKPVEQYIKRSSAHVYGHVVAALLVTNHGKEIRDVCTGRMHDTAVSVWVKWLWNWGERGATDVLCQFMDICSPFLRCFEEVNYERRTGDILVHLQGTCFPEWPFDWLNCSVLPFPTIVSTWWKIDDIGFTMSTSNAYVRSLSRNLHGMPQH